jgi:hypothetical protein
LQKNGKPLPGGFITFTPNPPVTGLAPAVATIKPDGTYDAPAVPVGLVQITITNDMLKKPDPSKAQQNQELLAKRPPLPKDFAAKSGDKSSIPPGAGERVEGGAAIEGTYVAIDPKYGNASKSGLSLQVTGGDQTHTVELK